ncbi:aldehyde dehydrogenase family protein [Haloechinothrix sp. YIM 98757]|uniref:Aldehyde dehydrogenase family protein n=1 Tax=Haloechinothrix aidingensis TaxID=2752311 RepID=A0A838A8K4_9PSEU|nr:aldehyde dehydrogenase family protein [Haloechinothrix aidingensis]MBA0124799.1 aldehyde dehydrogenase family protein [Haloechinothrix aidingensis]
MDTIMPEPRACWIAGTPEQGETTATVTHPYDGSPVADAAVPGDQQVERAVQAASAAVAAMRSTPARTRSAVLVTLAARLRDREEEITELLTAECGTPITRTPAEVAQAAAFCEAAAETAPCGTGRAHHHAAVQDHPAAWVTIRPAPRGPVLGIGSSGAPLWVAVRQAASALAAGAPIVLKPAQRAPLSALLLGELLADAELPTGWFSVLPAGHETTRALAADPRLPVVLSSGAGSTGDRIASAAGRKRVAHESGGLGTAIVLSDWPDLHRAAERVAAAGTAPGGVSSRTTQRVIVEEPVADEFVGLLSEAVRQRRTGSPYDDAVDVGPLPDEESAAGVTDAIAEATSAGARVRAGGTRDGAVVEPTVLTDVGAGVALWDRPVTGPVLAVRVAGTADEAYALACHTPDGSAAGVFTRDTRRALHACERIDAGSVIIGDVSPFSGERCADGTAGEAGVEGVRAMVDTLLAERRTVFLAEAGTGVG